jgi:hypothetical protein
MSDREILDADAGRDLVVDNAVNDRGEDAQGDDKE